MMGIKTERLLILENILSSPISGTVCDVLTKDATILADCIARENYEKCRLVMNQTMFNIEQLAEILAIDVDGDQTKIADALKFLFDSALDNKRRGVDIL
jgi:hypothetical protein